ncbi:hypothetical protein KC323_g218 [Hortaea werneckii]|nr:hypothetical protein KC323_g218 [Hortaea werneckii]
MTDAEPARKERHTLHIRARSRSTSHTNRATSDSIPYDAALREPDRLRLADCWQSIHDGDSDPMCPIPFPIVNPVLVQTPHLRQRYRRVQTLALFQDPRIHRPGSEHHAIFALDRIAEVVGSDVGLRERRVDAALVLICEAGEDEAAEGIGWLWQRIIKQEQPFGMPEA